MLSDDDLKKAYWKARSEIGGDAAGLRAVAEAAVKDAAGAGFPELCELMRGLEIPPSALSLGPRGLYLIGKAIADQAKEANEEL